MENAGIRRRILSLIRDAELHYRWNSSPNHSATPVTPELLPSALVLIGKRVHPINYSSVPFS
jgi:hypothetical protein